MRTDISTTTMATPPSTMITEPAAHSRLRLWQLISPTLPVGAYAYSGGLEYAVEAGWVHDEPSAGRWITGLMGHTLTFADIPLLARFHRAWSLDDPLALEKWARFLRALRESSELRAEDHHLGMALARVLVGLGVERAAPWCEHPRASYPALFALAMAQWEIPLREGAEGYLWAWCENQVAAAIKLVPLGQSAGQRILASLLASIPDSADVGLDLEDAQIGAQAPGLGIASARHEHQYSRLFRS